MNNWQIKSLKEIGQIISGGTPSTTIPEYWNGQISWISPSDLTGYKEKYISKGAKSITEMGLQKSSARVMPKNSILFSCRAPIGYVAIAKNELATNQGFKSIIPKENVSSEYVYYFLKASKNKAESVASGTTFKEISLKSFSELQIPLPPLPTQHLIVSKIEELFSEIDKGIEELKTAQQQLKVYRQSVLKWAFEGKLTNDNVKEGKLPKGWTVLKIGDVCKSIVPNRDKPKSFSGDIKWVTTPFLNPSSIKLSYDNIPLGLTEEEVTKFNARVVPIGGVIMTCVGTFGLSAIVERPLVINQQLHAFISNELTNPKYIAYLIQFNKNYFEQKSTSTTIQYVNKENCNSMPIPLCSLEEQHRIVQEIERRLSVADKLAETITTNLALAESLKQSVLKKAFSGELVA